MVKYRIYRGTDPGFVPSAGLRVRESSSLAWQDPAGDVTHYYKVTAVDNGDNESDPASPQTTTDVRPAELDYGFALKRNVPNPFNPSTTIGYTVANRGARVTLTIFDAVGRRVRTLVDASQTAGHKVATWDGTDARGRRVASGIYFYRLTAPGFSQTQKMVLLK